MFASRRDITSSKIQDENFMRYTSNSESFLLDTSVYEPNFGSAIEEEDQGIWRLVRKPEKE